MTTSNVKSYYVRAAVSTVLAGALILGIVACGGDKNDSDAKSSAASTTVDVRKIESLAAPDDFEVLDKKPDLELAKKLAADPVPPGFQIHPPQCATESQQIDTAQFEKFATRRFSSSTSTIAVLAYDAGPNASFDVPEDCKTFTMSGPDGAGAIFAPWTKIPEIPGADAIRASHSVIRERAESVSYDSYVYTAKVRNRYRVVVAIAPNPRQQNPKLQTRTGVEDVLRRAVTAITR